MRDVAQRLRRLLYIVPYVAKHREGVRVDQLAKHARRRARRAARRSRAAVAGRPARRRSGRVPAGLRRGRPRVRRPRAPPDAPAAPDRRRGLLAAARHPRAARERHRAVRRRDAVAPRQKLLHALGRDAREAENLATSHGRRVGPDAAVATHLRTLVTAARQRERVEIDYAVGVARIRPSAARSIRTASSTTRASGTSSATATSAATSARSASIGSPRCAPRRAVRPPGRLRSRGLPPRAALRAERRRHHRAGPARSARGHAHRRELAGRRGHDAGRRLGRAARRLRRLRVGHRLGARPRPARLDRRAAGSKQAIRDRIARLRAEALAA